MKIVMKFGGTSVGDAESIRLVAESVKKYSVANKIVVVVSAMSGVTDTLIKISEQAKAGQLNERNKELKKIRYRHVDVVKNAIFNSNISSEVLKNISSIIDTLQRVCEGISVLGEMTPKSRDNVLSFGERLSTPIVEGAIRDFGLRTKQLTGGEAGIVTDEEFGEANPLMNVSKRKIAKNLQPLLDEGVIPVVAGFIAVTQTGDTTTLGRGGSDFTAAILGTTLSADEVWICTDVKGMMTADPKIVPDARTIMQLSYSEALEMTVFGVKALHPRALEPTLEYNIPVRVKNTFDLAAPGTLITKNQDIAKDEIVKSVSLIRDVAMVNIWGAGMVGKPGIAAKVFEILARSGINILMISQSVSEANISLILRRDYLEKAVSALEIYLLGKGFAKQINAEDDVGVVAVVGAGMNGFPGVASRVFKAVADQGINVRMIAQGSSELNISFVVKEKDSEQAVRAIHNEFNLSKS